MTEEQFIDALFVREGDRYADQESKPPIDQPTGRGGITLGTLRDYVAATGSALTASVDTLKALTHDQARAIVTWKVRTFVRRNDLHLIDFEPLRWFIVDFAYNSGASRAIRWLQRVLGVRVTGAMDAPTVAQLRYPDLKRIPFWIHQAAIAARLQMVDKATDRGGSIDHHLEEGLENRVFSFSLLDVS